MRAGAFGTVGSLFRQAKSLYEAPLSWQAGYSGAIFASTSTERVIMNSSLIPGHLAVAVQCLEG